MRERIHALALAQNTHTHAAHNTQARTPKHALHSTATKDDKETELGTVTKADRATEGAGGMAGGSLGDDTAGGDGIDGGDGDGGSEEEEAPSQGLRFVFDALFRI